MKERLLTLQVLGPVLASCLLFALSQPPFNLALLSLAALVPWMAWMRDAPDKQARISGGVFGTFFAYSQLWFIVVVLNNYTGVVWYGIAAYLLTGVLAYPIFWVFGAAIKHCWNQGWWWLIPFVWAGGEGFRSFSGPYPFPWATLAHSFWAYPAFVQTAAFGTIFFVSAWCVGVNLALVFLFFPSKEPSQKISGSVLYRLATILVAVMLTSVWRYSIVQTGARKTFVLAQPGIDLGYTHGDERIQKVWDSAAEIRRQVELQGGGDLVVLPEGYIPGGEIPPVNPYGPKPPFSVIQGGTVTVGDRNYQGAFCFDKTSGHWGTTAKERLVLLGEYLPDFLDGMDLGFKSFAAGRQTLLEASGMKIGCSLCYEGLFSDLTSRFSGHGANLLAVISIDDWYVGTPAWDMLWQSTIWRSIESGLPTVRVGGLGRTLACDSRGNLTAFLPPNRTIARRVEMTAPDEADGFAYRMVFVWLCMACLGGTAVHAYLTSRNRKEG